MNRNLKDKVWEKDEYYDLAKKGSLEINHPGIRLLLETVTSKSDILDIGCGEGTRLNMFKGLGRNLTGIDISSMAIKRARNKYSGIKFVTGNIEKLPFPDGVFDLVYSAFVFEHLDKPEQVLKEAKRVLKKYGNLLIIAPNFGAPNRASPPFAGSRMGKLVSGIIRDIFTPDSSFLHWKKVKPIADSHSYKMDWDTTIEPYLGSLIPFISNLGFRVLKSSSCWSEEQKEARGVQKIFRLLGELNIYPFSNWGPHLVLLAVKS